MNISDNPKLENEIYLRMKKDILNFVLAAIALSIVIWLSGNGGIQP